jgi:hypothetical protein
MFGEYSAGLCIIIFIILFIIATSGYELYEIIVAPTFIKIVLFIFFRICDFGSFVMLKFDTVKDAGTAVTCFGGVVLSIVLTIGNFATHGKWNEWIEDHVGSSYELTYWDKIFFLSAGVVCIVILLFFLAVYICHIWDLRTSTTQSTHTNYGSTSSC